MLQFWIPTLLTQACFWVGICVEKEVGWRGQEGFHIQGKASGHFPWNCTWQASVLPSLGYTGPCHVGTLVPLKHPVTRRFTGFPILSVGLSIRTLNLELPLWHNRILWPLGSTGFPSLAWHSGLRIQCCNCNWDLDPWPGSFICLGTAKNKQTTKKKTPKPPNLRIHPKTNSFGSI